jgi:hypothetical protein
MMVHSSLHGRPSGSLICRPELRLAMKKCACMASLLHPRNLNPSLMLAREKREQRQHGTGPPVAQNGPLPRLMSRLRPSAPP